MELDCHLTVRQKSIFTSNDSFARTYKDSACYQLNVHLTVRPKSFALLFKLSQYLFPSKGIAYWIWCNVKMSCPTVMSNSTLSCRRYFFLDVQYMETFGLMFSTYCTLKIRRNAFSVIDVCDLPEWEFSAEMYLTNWLKSFGQKISTGSKNSIFRLN